MCIRDRSTAAKRSRARGPRPRCPPRWTTPRPARSTRRSHPPPRRPPPRRPPSPRPNRPRSRRRRSSAGTVAAVSIVDKPWGHEKIWARTERYVGKILHIRAGEALSLQYHRVKDETIMLLRGRMQLEYFADGEAPRVRELAPREPFH